MKELVAKCAEAFDGLSPGWHGRVDKQRLNMANASDCVGGQVFGSFQRAKEALGAEIGRDWGLALNSQDLRFNHHLAWKELREMWVEEIEARLLRDELEAAGDIGVRSDEELALA